MKIGFTVTRDEDEIDLIIEGTYIKGCKGSTDGKYGPKLEPDEPPDWEILSVKDPDGNEFELTQEECEQVVEEALIEYDEMINAHYEDLADMRYEEWLDNRRSI